MSAYVPIPRIIQAGINSYLVYGEHVLCTDFLRAPDRGECETYLVKTQHPLAFEAGTAEYRFARIVVELANNGVTF